MTKNQHNQNSTSWEANRFEHPITDVYISVGGQTATIFVTSGIYFRRLWLPLRPCYVRPTLFLQVFGTYKMICVTWFV